MKICPDCAESVQDAARKCRYCGYLFDPADATTLGNTATASRPLPPPEVAALPTGVRATPVASAPVFLVLAAGGAAIAIAQIAQMLVLIDPGSATRAVALVDAGGLVCGGILLAIGWGLLVARGVRVLGGLLGGLAMAAGPLIAVAFDIEARHADVGQGMFVLLGLAIGLIAHLGALEEVDFDGTRLAAILAAIGFGGEAIGVTRHWGLPGFVWVALAWCGTIGSILFGIALAVAASHRSRRS